LRTAGFSLPAQVGKPLTRRHVAENNVEIVGEAGPNLVPAGVEVGAPAKPKKFRVLNVSVRLAEDSDAGKIIAAVVDLGEELQAVSINNQFDYGDDYLY
jgi:hypothetical protein